MRQDHIDAQINFIKSIISSDGSTMLRKKAYFGVSERQVGIAKRILKVKHIIETIPDDRNILVFGAGEPLTYLFRLTKLYHKKVIGIAECNPINDIEFCDVWHKNRIYPVCAIQEGIKRAEYVILTQFKDWGENQREILNRLNYKGGIVSIYDKEDDIPFYCYKKSNDKDTVNCPIYQRICDCKFYPADDYDLTFFLRIEKINEKLEICRKGRILIYGVGGHTDALLELTDIKYMNIVGFVDKNKKKYFDLDVRNIEKKSFLDADHIVVSSYIYQAEIKGYLDEIGVGEKAVLLYDELDPWEFYKNKNVFAPDLRYERKGETKYGIGDVYAYLEKNLNDLTRNSDFYLTYTIYPDDMDSSAYFYRGEKELLKIKEYNSYNKNTAIIIQGPIIYDCDFTFKTILFYQRHYPEAVVILSTWKEEKLNPNFMNFYDLGIEIVLSDVPETKGLLNVNYQCRSTYAGLKRADEMGIPYSLKIRTDFRMYEEGILSHLINLLNHYPICGNERKRLIVLPPVMDVAYYIPDFIIFGRTKELKKFWNASEFFPNQVPEEFAKDGIINPEGLLFGRYLRKIGKYLEKPIQNIEKYRDLICNEFIVVNHEIYKYIWKKYSYESSVPFFEQKNIFTSIDWMNQILK